MSICGMTHDFRGGFREVINSFADKVGNAIPSWMLPFDDSPLESVVSKDDMFISRHRSIVDSYGDIRVFSLDYPNSIFDIDAEEAQINLNLRKHSSISRGEDTHDITKMINALGFFLSGNAQYMFLHELVGSTSEPAGIGKVFRGYLGSLGSSVGRNRSDIVLGAVCKRCDNHYMWEELLPDKYSVYVALCPKHHRL